VDELNEKRQEERQIQQLEQENEFNQVHTRSLASTGGSTEKISKQDPVSNSRGLNVFQTLKGLEISLRTNDKAGVQDSLDMLDQAISQVVLARAELGSRVSSLIATTDSLQKAVLDNKAMASQMEDTDVFKLVSDINKTESTLKATMETSSKMVQRSLLDFLR
jgi:flagellar hook-associated protein 3 FlgL